MEAVEGSLVIKGRIIRTSAAAITVRQSAEGATSRAHPQFYQRKHGKAGGLPTAPVPPQQGLETDSVTHSFCRVSY